MRYVLLLLLLSCGAPGHEYMRGTMVAPPPAPARPGVGAPIRGQPGEPHAYPRSPYTRMLPQTPETMRRPGIWASSEPSNNALVVEGVSIPLPEAVEPVGRKRADECAAGTSYALRVKPDGQQWLNHSQPDMKTCLVYLAWRTCMASPLWTDGQQSNIAIMLRHIDAVMMAPPPKCKAWEYAFNTDIRQPFEWGLKTWYYRQHRGAP